MSCVARLGLTGGIGSGKSTVAQLLAKQGAAVVDADAIARELTLPKGLAMTSIKTTFGASFVTPTGALDRDKMRALVHNDSTARQRLENIIHPLVALETQRQAVIATEKGYQCIVFDVPLLVESAVWRQRVERVLVIDCTPEVQIKRVMARNQLPREQIEKIILSQIERKQRLKAADAVIFNANLSFDELAHEVDQISYYFGLSSLPHLAYPQKSA